MPLFASSRERRLWLWTLVVVVAIYSTLVLARTVAVELRSRGLIDSAFVFALLLAGLCVFILGLLRRPTATQVAIALGVAAAYLCVALRMALPEERTHLFEYSIVAAFMHEALLERKSRGRRVPVPALLAIGGSSLIGVIDECIQGLLPSRVFDPVDMLFNTLASTMAVLASVLLRRFGRRAPRPPAAPGSGPWGGAGPPWGGTPEES